jgi:DAACS family dicarboxylate/amino acid:cation (Na+ or H+) symporter
VGIKTLIYTVLLSSIAVLLALAVANLFEPGAGVDRAQALEMLERGRENAGSIISAQEEKPSGVAAVLALIPTNIVKAMADNDILAVMFFALIFGIGLLLVNTPTTNALQRGFEGLFQVAMKLIGLVIRLAPIAIACFMFNLAAVFGWNLLQTLALYVFVVLLALAIQMFIVYPAAIALIARRSPLTFFRDIQAAMVVAFSTASSNATLPTALKVADENLKLPGPVARFVLTIGATANQNGTAIFEGVTVLFLAQFFGVELSIGQQITVLLMCILAGVGTAGVPAGSLPVVAIILAMVGVDPVAIGLVLGVDRLLDMCRTTLNVTGDLAIATMVSRGEDALAPAHAGGAPAGGEPIPEPFIHPKDNI